MGALGGMFGLSGGVAGTGMGGPQGANIQTPITNEQISSSYLQNQQALEQQQNLLNALQGQGGIQNQSQVYGQLQDIAAGKGPNPAQAMLNQATGQNIASQAALMAGQRGSNANIGLMARQIAQQGGALQQQAAGQGATMQAQQALGAIGQAGSLANQQVANQMAATNALTGAQQSQFGNLANALAAQNQARVSERSSINAANAGLAQTQMQGQQALIGGGLNAAGAGFGGGKAHGGVIGMADGGVTGPQSSFGQFLSSVNRPSSMPAEMPQFASSNPGAASISAAFAKMKGKNPPPMQETPASRPSGPGGMMSGPALKSGGMVDVVLSPGEKVVAPEKVGEAAGGKVEAKTVPGKANVSGDSYKNDTYKTKLPEGAIVVPRTKSGSERDVASFVRAVLAKRGRK